MSLKAPLIKKFSLPVFRILLVVFYTVFLFSLVSLIIPPHTFWLASVCTLLIPPLVFLNLVFLILFFFYKVNARWISLLFFAFSFYYFHLLYRMESESAADPAHDFKVLSYNISGNKLVGKPYLKNGLEDFIIGEKADIVCLQEIFNDSMPSLDKAYPFRYLEADTHVIGVGIYSKYPIVGHGIVFIGQSDYNKGIYADILVQEKKVRVVSVHFESNSLRRGNPFLPLKKFLHNIRVFEETSKIRSKQAQEILRFAKADTLPLIVAGDFNEPPHSYVYTQLKSGLKNSFDESGSGFGFTFVPQKTFLRIDHHFTNDELIVEDYKTYPKIRLSDHLPCAGLYSFRK